MNPTDPPMASVSPASPPPDVERRAARQNARRALAVLAIAAALAAAFVYFHLGRFLSLDELQAQRQALAALRAAHPWAFALAYFSAYVVVAGLSLPGALVMTLAGGALFGLVWGTLLVSFASTAGACLAFLASRFVLRGWLEARYGQALRAIDAGVARDGAFYLFSLRLIPVFPFFVVNLLFGLTPLRLRTYAWVSQLGMLPATLLYVNAGTQLARLHSLHGILSPALLASLALLGVFPLGARKSLDMLQARRVYRPYVRPRAFDRNLIVIGAGAAGLVASYIAAALKAKVTLIEGQRMGGDCLNTGCVPSKALIRSARYASQLRRAAEYGFVDVQGRPDFARVMERVAGVVRAVAPHDSVERYTALGVEVLMGRARLVDPWTVEVRTPDGGTRRLSARGLVIATGAEPFVPPIPGLQEAGYLTSDTLWSLRELPRRLVVLGGGPIGCELTQAFARLGARVTQVEMLPRLLPREDPEVSALVAEKFRAEGVDLRIGTQAKAVWVENGTKVLVCAADGREERIAFDHLLVAVGRRARLTGYGLEELGVRCGKTLEVNAFMQTNFPNIYACGDVASPYQFTHVGAHTAWYAAINALFGPWLALRGGRFKADFSVIPWTTFTEPEVARVGLNETEAREKNIPYEVVRYELAELDRAIAEGETEGFVKVLTAPGRDRVLGATIVGAQAGELIAEFVLAMRQRIGLNKLLGTIHVYPTLAEANKYAAGLWRQAHRPEKILALLERFHRFRRGAPSAARRERAP